MTVEEVIQLKYAALRERWAGDGYLAVMPDNIYQKPSYYLYGWAGQSLRLALCDLRYGVRYTVPAGIKRCLHAAEFFIKNSRTTVPGLRFTTFFLRNEEWRPGEILNDQTFSARALGETWSNFARILLFCREHGITVPDDFLPALREGLEFMLSHRLAEGVTPIKWTTEGCPASGVISAAGSSFLVALFVMARLTSEKYWLEQAEELLRRYWSIGGNHFDTPFSRATLDSGCEDKEAAIPFFIAAAEAWRQTGSEEYKHWAEASADWLLTWVYFWNVPFRPGSICDRQGFKSVGWPAVSVENQHLDVFFPAWELFKFGSETGNRLYMDAGELVFKAWSHGISQGSGDWLFAEPGRQAEQFFQTD